MQNLYRKLQNYLPLFVLVSVAALAALAVSKGTKATFPSSMHYFMGFFFCQFAMLKLFHLKKFTEGFRMYDMLAINSPGYAYIYPFLELGLGLCYLSFLWPNFTYSSTVLLMGISAVGVIRALKKGLNLKCACMGTILDVPLSTVTLVEDLAMGIMALFMLL